jgi:hypothetical protein
MSQTGTRPGDIAEGRAEIERRRKGRTDRLVGAVEVAEAAAGADPAPGGELAPAALVEGLAAAAVDGPADARIQRLARLTRLPRHVRAAHGRLIDAEAADRLADLLVTLEGRIDNGELATPALFADFEGALARWRSERGFDAGAA